ncbi:MAG: SUMF1/EgtB/PvdO family nonheme iron enzyme [Nitrospinae bacterium]|nr:SUMF1/EgtB/PvdO family nonheme iron enzyme [Nitrospinota bacterium]
MKATALFLAPLLLACLPITAMGAEPAVRALIPKGAVILGTDMESLKKLIAGKDAKPEWYADETPSKKTETGTFEIDIHEVTNARFKEFYKEHSFPPNLANHPVVNVTWKEANDYCRGTGGRLPTEAEWVRAARGNTANVYPWGNEFNPQNTVYMDSAGGGKMKAGSYAVESSGENELGGTWPAGSIEAGKSPFGVYDMAGNAWEWVDGWYDEGKKLRMLKGGSWLSPWQSLRISARLGDGGERKFNDYGFRCVYNPKQ